MLCVQGNETTAREQYRYSTGLGPREIKRVAVEPPPNTVLAGRFFNRKDYGISLILGLSPCSPSKSRLSYLNRVHRSRRGCYLFVSGIGLTGIKRRTQGGGD